MILAALVLDWYARKKSFSLDEKRRDTSLVWREVLKVKLRDEMLVLVTWHRKDECTFLLNKNNKKKGIGPYSRVAFHVHQLWMITLHPLSSIQFVRSWANWLKTPSCPPCPRCHYSEKVGVEQASEITGYSKNTLYQMHSQGKIPCAVKVGSKLMFRTRELQDWVDNGGPNSRNNKA